MPEQFEKWRPNQEDAILKLLASPRRVKALCAPTGFGKTPVYVAAALLSKQPTCFVTESRGLQDQLLDSFQSVGMVDIRGRRNYHCDMREGHSCEEGYVARCPYKGTVQCPASQAEMRAAVSPLVVTNYDKWTSARKFGQGMSHFQQVVFDEGHEAPAALARAMQVVLHSKEIEDDLGVPFPSPAQAEEMVNWRVWASGARAEAEDRYLIAREHLAGRTNVPHSWVKEVTHLRHLVKRLATLATADPANWVVDEVKDGYQFDPVRPGRYAEGALLLRVPSILIVSATLRPKTMFMLGIARDQFDFYEYPSEFDSKRCPIYYIPTMRVDSKAPDLSPLWIKLDQIAARRRDRKGIVHTVSYARRNEIVGSSRFAASMFVNEKGEPASWMIENFKDSGPGAILVSPSVGAGYDFPRGECEWQLVCKIPFQPPSRIIKAREEDDKEYRGYQAMQKMVQMFGRGMRSRDDQCESFICDRHLDWFLPKYRHLAPKWFHNFFREVAVVPPPPPRL